MMKVVFLGTGTSVGVPAIGCTCPVCTSPDPRNRRLRSSLYVEAGGTHLVIDTTPDFRTQALTYRVPRVDAVLFTHSHADHILGFDDIRRYNTLQGGVIPAYGAPDTIADLNRIFDYFHHEHPPDVYRPHVEFRNVEGPFEAGAFRVTPVPVPHSRKTTLGYRLEAGTASLGYVPDCHDLPESALGILAGVDVMVLDALRRRPHSTHLTLERSVGILRRLGARTSFLVHMGHDLDHETTQRSLPEGVWVSYDGLRLSL